MSDVARMAAVLAFAPAFILGRMFPLDRTIGDAILAVVLFTLWTVLVLATLVFAGEQL